MEIQYTIQGLLIYMVFALYIITFLAKLINFKKLSSFTYLLAFVFAIAALIYRGFNVGHFPLQNLFEVFLFLGSLSFPMSVLSKKYLQIYDNTSDILIGIIILFPAGFVFSAQPRQLPPALQSIFFVPHVLSYMLAYVILTKAAVLAVKQLFSDINHEVTAYKIACVGFPFLTLGLILGSIWAKIAWSDYWSWDPKELWSLATWLVYVGYFHFRAKHIKNKKANSIWLITGLVFIVITLLWVNLSRIFTGMHSYA